jgi:hypothetical protein
MEVIELQTSRELRAHRAIIVGCYLVYLPMNVLYLHLRISKKIGSVTALKQ